MSIFEITVFCVFILISVSYISRARQAYSVKCHAISRHHTRALRRGGYSSSPVSRR